MIFFSLGLGPCAPISLIKEIVSWAVPISFVIATLMFIRLSSSGAPRSAVAAILLPAVAVAAYLGYKPFDAAREAKCAAQTWQEAIASCRANPSNYRLGKSAYGNATLTLYAPGDTDRAWSCLTSWNIHNDKYSLLIDESVYDLARRRYKQDQSGHDEHKSPMVK